jgi:hypothetical protein
VIEFAGGATHDEIAEIRLAQHGQRLEIFAVVGQNSSNWEAHVAEQLGQRFLIGENPRKVAFERQTAALVTRTLVHQTQVVNELLLFLARALPLQLLCVLEAAHRQGRSKRRRKIK